MISLVFNYSTLFYIMLIEFNCTFSISYKTNNTILCLYYCNFTR